LIAKPVSVPFTDQRPEFCRVQPDIFAKMYQIEPGEFEQFAIRLLSSTH
jgi:hypothetical protein